MTDARGFHSGRRTGAVVVFPDGAPNSRVWCGNRPTPTRISTPGGGLEAVLGTLPPKEADFGGEKTCGSLTVEPEPAPVSQRQTARARGITVMTAANAWEGLAPDRPSVVVGGAGECGTLARPRRLPSVGSQQPLLTVVLGSSRGLRGTGTRIQHAFGFRDSRDHRVPNCATRTAPDSRFGRCLCSVPPTARRLADDRVRE